ncbi:MAG: glycosyltransferase family 4 protein [Pseudomonadota bacterium]
MTHALRRIAFYAPLKPPDHPTPSGDRQIARLFLEALRRAGFEPVVASQLRLREPDGTPTAQAELSEAALAEADRLIGAWQSAPPQLWFTYHCYWKAPDLIGPRVSAALGIPYVIAEPSHTPSRLTGKWAGFAAQALSAILQADRLIVTKPRDMTALRRIASEGQIAPLPPFVDPGADPSPHRRGSALRLLTVGMMRPGDKLASYRALAEALAHLDRPWSLTVVGDGPARGDVGAALAPFPDIRFAGALGPDALRALYETHDVMLWPGNGEGIGMVYLEAQAAGCPALAAAHPGPAAVLATADLPAPGDARGFAKAALALARDPQARRRARQFVTARHDLAAAATRLGAILTPLLSRSAP